MAVIGGTGLIGSKLVGKLCAAGHDVLAASPRSGVNTVTGEGLDTALAGAQVVVDVSNSPSFADDAVMSFFQASTGNLMAAETAAGVGHHLALSVVGADRLADSGYMRAKIAQETLIKESGIPYTILRATQFFEFVEGIAASCVDGDTVRATSATLQPIASDDVVATLAELAQAAPVNGMLELGGPEAIPLDDLIRRLFRFKHDARPVVTDPQARYFGSLLNDHSITPEATARRGGLRFEEWLSGPAA